MSNFSQKGVSLYLALVIMAVLLAIALGLSTLLFGQIRIIRGMGDSVVAFYAADTGIERVLYYIRVKGYMPKVIGKPFCLIYSCPPLLDNKASYIIKIKSANSEFTIQSRGSYEGTNRAIEINY